MELWFTERQTADVGITCRVGKTLTADRTEYQEMAVYDTNQFGRMLVLDGAIQTTIADEFVYHEMIAHVPLFTHPNPRRVLVIGGGDGGAVREILKHPTVERVELVEIDARVVETCKTLLPELSSALDDPRAKVVIADGVEYVRARRAEYDVAIVDSPDPVGPAVGLFEQGFYASLRDSLKEDGLFVAQTESPFYTPQLVRRTFHTISGLFQVTRLYLASIPTYPSGLWSFTMGSKGPDPCAVDVHELDRRAAGFEFRYYCPELHAAAFVLPAFVRRLVTASA